MGKGILISQNDKSENDQEVNKMPGFDGTGPRGMGPMAGGGRGFCGNPGAARRPLAGGRPFFGWGGGRGWRNQYHATGLPRWQRWGLSAGNVGDSLSGDQEQSWLKNQAEILRKNLEDIERRLAELAQENK
jgi:hypothetical protein